MKKLQLLNTILLLGIITYLVLTALSTDSNGKEVYVVTGELHQNFDYQKELNEEYLLFKSTKEEEVKKFAESLNMLKVKIESQDYSEQELYDYQVGLNRLQIAQQDLNQELTNLNGEYNAKIWEKLNVFVKSYGNENDCSIIFGADGDGNIMYAKDMLNVTEEVTIYCNQKYKGI